MARMTEFFHRGNQDIARWRGLRAAWSMVSVAVVAAATSSLPAGEQVRTWGEGGTWAFQTGEKLEGGALDLRTLNESIAGEHGFVRLSKDGNSFVRADGEPIRFWGVAAHVNKKVSNEDLACHARFLARVGVNMVRVGGASSGLIPQEEDAKLTDVNEAFVRDVWRTVAAMKKQGIYTRIAPFWDHGSVKHIDPNWGIEGYKSGDTLNALLFFEPTLQRAYKAWMKHLLVRKNPYTGIPLKDDSALAIVQIVSEDSVFFWWIDKVHGGPRRELERRFAAFAAGLHGSVDKALAAWDGAEVKGDDLDAGRLGLYPLYNVLQWPGAGNRRRIRDQVAFLSKLERDFYAEMKRYLHQDLGAHQLIAASNFGPADDVRLGDLQRWDWSACDVIEQNQFVSTVHKGPQAFWRIDAGNFFVPHSAMRDGVTPAVRKHVVGRPFLVSSTNWVPPNPYTAEGPVMTAAYGAMNGLDGVLWFAAQAPAYHTQPYMTWWTIKGSHPMPRWSISHPAFLSQFPAASLMLRQGLVDPAGVVVHEARSVEEMVGRQAPLLTESLTYDPAEHIEEAPQAKRLLMEATDANAFLVGRVEAVYSREVGASRVEVEEISKSVDGHSRVVRTMHGQLSLDRSKGVLRIDAPQAQGVVGFLKAAGGDFRLRDASIRSDNEYASIVLVPLDGLPLRTSRKVLVQVGTRAFPTGWATRPATRKLKGQAVEGLEIVSTGKMPWRVENASATLSIANPVLRKATRLDEMGFAAEPVPVRLTNGRNELTLPPNALYVLWTATGDTAD